MKKIELLILVLFLLSPILLMAGNTDKDYKTHRVEVNGIKLEAREYESDGEAIIFLHFGGGNMMVWQRVVPDYVDNFKVILVDLRGHGKSEKPATGNQIDVMAKDIICLLDFLKIEKTHVVGSSLGAEVALSMGANYKSRVLSLVCEGALYSEYGPYGVWKGSEEEFNKSAEERIDRALQYSGRVFDSIEEYINYNKTVFQSRAGWNKYFEEFKRYDACEVQKSKFTDSWQKHSLKDYLINYFNYRFEDYYSKVECPLIMLAGDREWEDANVNKAMRALVNLSSDGKLVHVPGWVHPYGWMLKDVGINKIILDFLEEVKYN